MKKQLFYLNLISLFLLSSCSYDRSSAFGNATFSHQNVKKINVFGSATLNNTTVTQDVSIFGSLQGESIQVNGNMTVNGAVTGNDINVKGNLSVNGSCEANKIHILGKTKITGYFETYDSTFNTISISTDKVVLHNSTVNSILIHKLSLTPNKQQLLILDNVVVVGDIAFENNNGKVILQNGSQVKGTITGATTETANP